MCKSEVLKILVFISDNFLKCFRVMMKYCMSLHLVSLLSCIVYLSAGDCQHKVVLGGRWLSWSRCDRTLAMQCCIEDRRPFQEAAFEMLFLNKFVLCLFLIAVVLEEKH